MVCPYATKHIGKDNQRSMKQKKWSSEEVLVEIITSMEAAQLEEQEKSIRERLGELSNRLQELMESHPDEYWEATVLMEKVPANIPRRPLPQKEFLGDLKKRRVLLSGKRGSMFDPSTPLNKDLIEAYETVQKFQEQMKDFHPRQLKHPERPWPWVEELRNLPPLGEKTVPKWKPWIRVAFLGNHNQHPEKTAHAAQNMRNRDTIKKISDPDKRDTAVSDRLLDEMVVVRRGALTMLAKDLDRARGL